MVTPALCLYWRRKGRQYVNLDSKVMSVEFRAAKRYQKDVIVQARFAETGEIVPTILTGIGKETGNRARKGDVTITNPTKEEYLISYAELSEDHDDIGGGWYRPNKPVFAFPNKTGQRPVVILAPWGRFQYGASDCWFAGKRHTRKPNRVGRNRYIIGAAPMRDFKKIT